MKKKPRGREMVHSESGVAYNLHGKGGEGERDGESRLFGGRPMRGNGAWYEEKSGLSDDLRHGMEKGGI